MYIEGDVPSVVSGGNGGNSGFGYGNDAWVLIILFALIFGWGRNGFGGGQGGVTADLSGILTRGDLCQDMNFNNLENAVRGISNGICDSTFALNNSINGVNTAILTSSNATQQGIANLGYNLQQCCCNLERGIDRLACQSATDTANIIQAGANNTQRILDYLCNEKISSLQAENSLLTSQLSQNAQTRTIIDTLLPVAKPAYITCSPYQSAFGYPYATSGCGCNSGYATL